MSAADDSSPVPAPDDPEAEALQREREGQAAAEVLARSPAQLAAEATPEPAPPRPVLRFPLFRQRRRR
jgi:hypothetical protein